MPKRVGIEVSIAIAEAVKLCDVDVISAYPITPQTHIVEHLSELVANGELDAEFIPVESEHTAISVGTGSSAVGARVYTATSSQGLALMHEILFIVSAMRLPMVMTVANRSLSAPISIWNDHSDIMAERDIGWIQTFAINGQEAYDLTFHAFRVAEDMGVQLPIIVNLDGFTLTHVIEPIELVEKKMVEKYLPPRKPVLTLHPDNPITMGPVGIPEVYSESRRQLEVALIQSYSTIIKAWQEFAHIFGREYHPIETYRTEEAELIFVTMGSLTETAMLAVDELREKGQKVGLVYIRLWRPFPHEDFQQVIKNAKFLVVLDRAITYGINSGPVYTEIRSSLYDKPEGPYVQGFVAGLGGRDIPMESFMEMAEITKRAKKGKRPQYIHLDVRED
jgi:pyruvate ferredoxin oxidoreductase alpha subunit